MAKRGVFLAFYSIYKLKQVSTGSSLGTAAWENAMNSQRNDASSVLAPSSKARSP